MIARDASCGCVNIRLRCKGEPVRISDCGCHERQKQMGNAFGAQARLVRENVQFLSGYPEVCVIKGESGAKIEHRFCSGCGSTPWCGIDNDQERMAVALGAFAYPSLPPPWSSV